MSNQIVISSGAKVRSLEGVLTGTAGIVNSVPLGGANGVATLDSLGKVPLSQLPASVVTYLGTWNAATNTPTLTNGVGDVGDLYICNVAGTVNFGAGPITFAVGDWVIYSGTEWQKSSGASGTVTSVAVTESGDALTITGSPITTSGTINIGFAGTGSQYIKGDGTLATFPTTIDQAKRLITEVYNSTGATLTKGTVVYINGGQGNLPTVTKAQANADNTSAQTYGVVQSDITNMNNGFVVVFGSLTDLDTQAYAVGTQLYLSGTTAGDWTSTKPSAPIHLVYVGIVVRSHPTQGVVEIRIQNGYELEELHDVAISSPVNNQGIFYNSSNDLWENKSIATALGYTPANDALVVHLAGTETITGSKIFSAAITADAGISLKEGVVPSAVGYTGLAGDADGLLITKRIGTTAYTNLFYFQAIDASNTYTYPNLSGTIALLEGTQTFTGAKTFSTFPTTFDAESIFNLGFQIKKITTGVSASAGYMAMYSPVGTANKIAFLDGDSTRVSTLTFDTTGSFSYTFPAINGTIALLEGTQTFTGAKTFNTAINADSSILLKNGVQSILSGYVNIAGNTFGKGIDISYYDTSGTSPLTQVLNFSPTTSYTYTFPSASGTIALTSNLSSYVPYTGATSDVNLGTTYSLNGYKIGLYNGSSYTNIYGNTDGISINFGTYVNRFYFNNSNRTYTFPDATGTIALTSNLSSYLPLTGGTLTGALNGTSATFNTNSTSNAGFFQINDSTTTLGNSFATVQRNANDGNGRFSLSRWQVQNTSGLEQSAFIGAQAVTGASNYSPNLILGVSNGASSYTTYLTLASTGAATFSSTLDTAGNITSTVGATNTSLFLKRTGNTFECVVQDNQSRIRTFGASGNDKDLLFDTDNAGTTRLFIKGSTGNVGIGTSSPTNPLHIASNSISQLNVAALSGNTNAQINLEPTGTGVALIGPASAFPLTFRTDATERMRITSGGDVVIGATSYSGVSGATIGLEVAGSNAQFLLNNTSFNHFTIYSAGDSNIYNVFGAGGNYLIGTGNKDTSSWAEKMRITTGGNVCINATSSVNSENLFVKQSSSANLTGIAVGYGTSANQFRSMSINASNVMTFNNGTNEATLTAAGAWTNASDVRLKKNIKTIKYGLNTILDTKPRSYNRVDVEGEYIGFIAQELMDIIPEVVSGDIEKQLCVDYGSMVSIAFKAIQELKAEIEELKALINK